MAFLRRGTTSFIRKFHLPLFRKKKKKKRVGFFFFFFGGFAVFQAFFTLNSHYVRGKRHSLGWHVLDSRVQTLSRGDRLSSMPNVTGRKGICSRGTGGGSQRMEISKRATSGRGILTDPASQAFAEDGNIQERGWELHQISRVIRYQGWGRQQDSLSGLGWAGLNGLTPRSRSGEPGYRL